jgi:transglutaminase-like putative cysteine protease
VNRSSSANDDNRVTEIEPKVGDRVLSVHPASMAIMYLAVILSTVPFGSTVGHMIAYFPSASIALVLLAGFFWFKKIEPTPFMKKMSWVVQFPLIMCLAFLLMVGFTISGNPQNHFGLLPLAAFCCNMLSFMVLTKPAPSRMGFMGGCVTVLLLIQVAVKQTLLDSIAAALVFFLVWCSMASRHATSPQNPRDNLGFFKTLVMSVKRTGLVLCVSLPMMIAFFLLFPRLPLGAVQEERPSQSSGSTGLSNSLTLGSITELKSSQEPAFRAIFKGDFPTEPSLYWRSIVLDKLKGQTWLSSTQMSGAFAVPRTTEEADKDGKKPEPPLSIQKSRGTAMPYGEIIDPNNRGQQIAVLDGTENNVVVSFNNNSVALAPYVDGTYSLRPTIKALRQGVVKVHAIGAVAYTRPEWSTLRPDNLGEFTDLPANFNPKTQAFGKQLRSKLDKPESVIDEVMSMIRRENFRYTLKPPALGQQAIDDFFFKERAGFCEHYASTFVVLMRSAGIPARLVTGYLSGPVKNGEIAVSQADAHAWAEVWLDGKGWVRQDPTASIDPSRVDPDATNARLESTPSGFLGFLNVTWRKNATQAEMFWRNTMLEFDSGTQSKIFSEMGVSKFGTPLLAAAAMLLMAGVAVAWQYLGDRWLRRIGRFGKRGLSDLLERSCARAGIERPAGTSWREVLALSERRLSKADWQELKALVEAHEQITYGAQGSDASAVKELSRRIRRFRPRAIGLASKMPR